MCVLAGGIYVVHFLPSLFVRSRYYISTPLAILSRRRSVSARHIGNINCPFFVPFSGCSKRNSVAF